MTRVAIAVLVLAGCNRVFGIPTADHAIDGAVALDGAASDAGNCGSHDEDADTVPDGCDLCPTIANAAVDDTDGDGVPDACDPAPAVLGDRLALFDGFEIGSAAWTATGTWTFAADDVRYSEAMLGHIHRPLPPGTIVVTAETEIAFTTGAMNSAAGIDLVLASRTFTCAVLRSTPDQLQLYETSVAQPLTSTAIGGSGPVRLRIGHLATGEITCRGARFGAAEVDASEIGQFPEAVTGVGFTSGGVSVELPFLAVYTSP